MGFTEAIVRMLSWNKESLGKKKNSVRESILGVAKRVLQTEP